MCLLVFRWSPDAAQRLVLAGNRDEFHGRPTAPMHWWDSPRVLAGRDLQAGGTWLAAGEDGRFGVVTNFRAPAVAPGGPSRGTLIPAYFAAGASPLEFLADLADEGARYAGFSLLLGNAHEVAYWSNHDAAGPRVLAPGTYGLSNGLLDTPWPKLVRTRTRFAALLEEVAPATDLVEPLFSLMTDREPAPDHELPRTGIDLTLERFLSSPFIVGPDYGTRCTSVLAYGADEAFVAAERSYAPDGRAAGTERFAPQAAVA